jgi:hypothetical protein
MQRRFPGINVLQAQPLDSLVLTSDIFNLITVLAIRSIYIIQCAVILLF